MLAIDCINSALLDSAIYSKYNTADEFLETRK